MKRLIPLVLALSFISLVPLSDAQNPVIELEKDSYEISVDPTEDEQGVLLIKGTFDPPDDQGVLSVNLESNITEYRDGEPTGRYWHSIVYFDDSQTANRIFSINKDSVHFSVEMDPELHDPQTDRDIPVPPGLSTDTWGELTVTATSSGAGYDGWVETDCLIYPEEFFLINLTSGTTSTEVEAGKILNYTLSMENGGNLPAYVQISIPLLVEFESEGWNTSVNRTEVPDLHPGDTEKIRLIMVAPDDIPRTETEYLSIDYRTAQEKENGDPAFSGSLEIEMRLKQSSIEDPTNGNGENGGNETNGEADGDDDGDASKYIIGILAAVMIIAGLLGILLFLMFRGGGGDDEEYDPGSEARASMFRM